MIFDRSKYVAFDVETSSAANIAFALQPFRAETYQADITSYAIAYYDEGGKLRTMARHMPTRQQLFDLIEWAVAEKKTLVGWNMAFDVSWLIAYGLHSSVVRAKFLDAMLLWMHLEREPESDKTRDKRRSYGLKLAVAKYFPAHAGYEDDVDYHDMSPEAIEKRLIYNRKDVAFTLKLAERFYNQMGAVDSKWLRNALIEAQSIDVVADSRVNGLVIDPDAAHTLDAKLIVVSEKALEILEPLGATPEILASPAQLAKLMFDDWKLPQIKKTPTGAPSTDKETLHELSLMDPRAKTIRAYREANNNRTKFVQSILSSVEYNGDGRTRPAATIYGTYTGRMTFSSKQGRGVKAVPVGFPLHQMKRGADFRNIVTVPPGFTLIEWDAAGQEFRWMAVESGDETMLSLCMPGEDPHSYMGAQIAHVDYRALIASVKDGDAVAKSSRQLGKVGNLSCQYRTSAAKLRSVARVQYNLPMELPEAVHIHGTYQKTYPGVPRYWARQIARAKRLGYVATLAGRRVQLPDMWGDRTKRWQLESTSINTPIQGVGADQKYLAIAAFKPYLTKVGGHFYFELHDGLYAIVPTPKAEKAAVEVRHILTNLPYKRAWGFEPPIPLPWDAKIGPSWGALKELHD